MPFFVQWPAQLPAGKVYDQPVIQLDIAADGAGRGGRAAAAMEARRRDPAAVPGRRQSDGPPHDALYWRFGQQMAIRDGDWKLVRYDPVADGEQGPPTKMRLYNLADDVGEEHDLSAENPAKFEQLRNDWKRWNAKNVKPRGAMARARREEGAPGGAAAARGRRARTSARPSPTPARERESPPDTSPVPSGEAGILRLRSRPWR